jgi:hypothetical protein
VTPLKCDRCGQLVEPNRVAITWHESTCTGPGFELAVHEGVVHEAVDVDAPPPRPPVPRDLGDFLVAVARASGFSVASPVMVTDIDHDFAFSLGAPRVTRIEIATSLPTPGSRIERPAKLLFEVRILGPVRDLGRHR